MMMQSERTAVKAALKSILPRPAITWAREIHDLAFPPSGIRGEVSYFHEETIRPEILARWFPTVLEIGVLDGGHSRLLLNACSRRFGRLIAIDPAPTGRIARILDLHPMGKLILQSSLDALPRLLARGTNVDIAVVDGDHNYYTVLHELFFIDQLLSPTGVVFVHDVGWPYGRRDGYYSPDRIPPEARHPSAKLGMLQGQPDLAESGGLNSSLANATHEGGPRNGVLTAVEDFIKQSGDSWTLVIHNDNHGLGILRRANPKLQALT